MTSFLFKKIILLFMVICILIVTQSSSLYANKIYISNADLIGSIVRTVRSIDSYMSCSVLCDKSRDCQAWTFLTSSRNCQLVNNVNKSTPIKKSSMIGCINKFYLK